MSAQTNKGRWTLKVIISSILRCALDLLRYLLGKTPCRYMLSGSEYTSIALTLSYHLVPSYIAFQPTRFSPSSPLLWIIPRKHGRTLQRLMCPLSRGHPWGLSVCCSTFTWSIWSLLNNTSIAPLRCILSFSPKTRSSLTVVLEGMPWTPLLYNRKMNFLNMWHILSVNTALSKMPFYILGTKCTSCLLRRCIYPPLPLLFASTCLNLQATFIYPLKYLLSFMWLWMQVWILWRSSLEIAYIPREESVLDVRERTHKGCFVGGLAYHTGWNL